MSRRLTAVLFLTCAVAVGTVYFPQAVDPLIASGFRVPPHTAALVVTATQIGYTAGIVLLAPLSDRLPSRPLLATLLALSGLCLLLAGCAPALPALVVTSMLIGLTSVAAQVVGPLAAGLVAADRQGAVIGTLLSGSTCGMLLARTFSGTLGEWLGWRAPYLVAAAGTLLLAVLAAVTVPTVVPPERVPYRALLIEPLRLLRTEPQLRRSCVNQACAFAGFTGPAYHLDAGAVGTLALVGAATMACTPFAGRLVDRRGPEVVNLLCTLGVLGSAAVLLAACVHGVAGLTALTLGVLLLDVAMQCGMVANQARVYALRTDARGRLKTAFMTCAYTAGSAGSWIGLRLWTVAGWPGVCALVAVLALVALTALRHRPARVNPGRRRRVHG